MLDKKTIILLDSLTKTEGLYQITKSELKCIANVQNEIGVKPWKEVAYNPLLEAYYDKATEVINGYTLVEQYNEAPLLLKRHIDEVVQIFFNEIETTPGDVDTSKYDVTITLYGKSFTLDLNADLVNGLSYVMDDLLDTIML